MAVVSCRCHKDLKMMKGREGPRPLPHARARLGCVSLAVECIPGPARVNSLFFGRIGKLELKLGTHFADQTEKTRWEPRLA